MTRHLRSLLTVAAVATAYSIWRVESLVLEHLVYRNQR